MAISAILHQLLSQRGELIPYTMKDYNAEGQKLPQLFQKFWNDLNRIERKTLSLRNDKEGRSTVIDEGIAINNITQSAPPPPPLILHIICKYARANRDFWLIVHKGISPCGFSQLFNLLQSRFLSGQTPVNKIGQG